MPCWLWWWWVGGNQPLSLFQMDVFDAADEYKKAGLPLLVLAGKEYGSGSSRDWAAKGPFLLVCPRAPWLSLWPYVGRQLTVSRGGPPNAACTIIGLKKNLVVNAHSLFPLPPGHQGGVG